MDAREVMTLEIRRLWRQRDTDRCFRGKRFWEERRRTNEYIRRAIKAARHFAL